MSFELDLMIDAGHGGSDSGAVGGGIKEKDLTLKMSVYQYERLKELGAKVGITRTTDKTIDSNPRASLIKNKAKYCMSNHFNSFNGEARGVETIHSIFSDDVIAKKIANEIVESSGLPFRRVFDRKGSNGLDYYFMHRLTGKTETIIVEYGFIDNTKDRVFYLNEANFIRVAESVIKVWCDILKIKYTQPKSDELKGNTYYRVVTGSFKDKENAEKRVRELEKKGFKSFIDIFKK